MQSTSKPVLLERGGSQTESASSGSFSALCLIELFVAPSNSSRCNFCIFQGNMFYCCNGLTGMVCVGANASGKTGRNGSTWTVDEWNGMACSFSHAPLGLEMPIVKLFPGHGHCFNRSVRNLIVTALSVKREKVSKSCLF